MNYPTDDSVTPRATEATMQGNEQLQQTTLTLAEDFHSYQGEGLFTGTPMHFIRTAGCNVGVNPVTDARVHYELGKEGDFPMLKTGRHAFRCHTHDGRGFWCDTDFQHGVVTSIREIIDNTWESHICITGGEPLLHAEKLNELIRLAGMTDIRIHIETSGTIEWYPYAGRHNGVRPWITVCPKQQYIPSMLEAADEIKLLVDPGLDINMVPQEVLDHPLVFVQPVNDELAIDKSNLALCEALLRKHPTWRLSVQLHKVFGWR